MLLTEVILSTRLQYEFYGNKMKLKDRFGRVHDYLRISLTDKCNFRCIYCMPSCVKFMPNRQLMSGKEIMELASVFTKDFGIKKIRLTGGEPLMRADCAGIISELASLNVELALTTNGYRLDKFLPVFLDNGLRSINVSLDTLIPGRFKEITGKDLFHKVTSNISLAVSAGLFVKVNTVVIKGINDDEIVDFVKWTQERPVHVRFIELMPFNGNSWNYDKVLPYADILEKLKNLLPVEKLHDKPSSTARNYRIKGFRGSFSVISSVTAPFCGTCNRLRLTADGKLRTCLFARSESDLLQPLRNGHDIRPIITASVMEKPRELGGLPPFERAEYLENQLSWRSMVNIGG